MTLKFGSVAEESSELNHEKIVTKIGVNLKTMSFHGGFSQFLTRFLSWAASCFVLFLLYTLVHETIEEQNSHLIDGEMETSKPDYRYPISESQGFEWNSRTILKHESVDWLNRDKIPGIIENEGRDDSRDEMNSSSLEKKRDPVLSRRLKSRPSVLSLAPLQSPSLAPNKSSSQTVKNLASQPDSRKFRSNSGSQAEALKGEIGHNSRFSEKLLKIGETTKDSNSIDKNFVSENLSSIEEGFGKLNSTHISPGIEEKDEELPTNVHENFEIYGEAYSKEEVTSSEKDDVPNKVDVKQKSNTLYINGADFYHTTQVNGRLDPAAKRNRIPSDLQKDKRALNVREFAQTTFAVQGASEENGEGANEAGKPSKYPKEFEENEKLESQESNDAQESHSKVLVSVSIASSNAGGGKTTTKLEDKTSPSTGKRLSFFTWLLRKSEASSFQKEDEGRSGLSLGDGIHGEELSNTTCVVDLNCRLYNFDLAPDNEVIVHRATCEKQGDSRTGTCTCGDFCVSKSHDYDTKKVYYYCGPCGRVGSSCPSNNCEQSNTMCKDSYCTCTQGDFYDLYYCVYNFNGYEKALQIAISICIALAIMLFVFTLCGARRRARGEEELSPFLMRLLLRRANEGTRESPPDDVPPSYEEVMASDQLPSYEDAMRSATQPSGLSPAEQDKVSVTSLISLKGEENYGFQGDEESMKNTENPSIGNHALPSVGVQQLQRGREISDASPRDVRISIAEDNESFEDDEIFEDDEFFRAIDPFAIGKRNAELSAPTTPASYVQMDPSTGAIPKHRKRETSEHLEKLKRGPIRKLEKKKDIQSELIQQDSSSYSSTDAHQVSNNANENCILESDTHLALRTANPQKSLSSIELWTPIATDRHETNQGQLSELTQLNNLHSHSSVQQGTGECSVRPSYESDSVSNLIFSQNSRDNIENSKL